jgi:hypothetical protein
MSKNELIDNLNIFGITIFVGVGIAKWVYVANDDDTGTTVHSLSLCCQQDGKAVFLKKTWWEPAIGYRGVFIIDDPTYNIVSFTDGIDAIRLYRHKRVQNIPDARRVINEADRGCDEYIDPIYSNSQDVFSGVWVHQ